MLYRSPAETLALRSERQGDCLVWTGAKDDSGYGMLTVNRRNVRAHQLAWVEAYGPVPDGFMIDHRCLNKACFRLEHLRLATCKQNNEHLAGAKANSKTGVRGVTFDPRKGKYRATVSHNRKQIWLGYYPTVEAADAAAQAGRAKYFTHA